MDTERARIDITNMLIEEVLKDLKNPELARNYSIVPLITTSSEIIYNLGYQAAILKMQQVVNK